MDTWNIGDWLTLLFAFLAVLIGWWQILRAEGMQPVESLRLCNFMGFGAIWNNDTYNYRNLAFDISVSTDVVLYSVRVKWDKANDGVLDKDASTLHSTKLSLDSSPLHVSFKQRDGYASTIFVTAVKSSPLRGRPVAFGWKIIIPAAPPYGISATIYEWHWSPFGRLLHHLPPAAPESLLGSLQTGRWVRNKPFWKSALPLGQIGQENHDSRDE